MNLKDTDYLCTIYRGIHDMLAKGPAPVSGNRMPLGKAKVVVPGAGVTIVSYSRTVLESLGALQALGEAGINAGAEIAAVVQEKLFGKLKAPVNRIGAPFNPEPFSKPLEAAHVTDAARIAPAVIELVKGS